ncbi:hydroxymethylglutaryl-CoA reductase, partial [Sulfobacillus acidophilus]|nr:hydroxymethylglutaryl-CoA reductase [Sulfobacillus acidophilus]
MISSLLETKKSFFLGKDKTIYLRLNIENKIVKFNVVALSKSQIRIFGEGLALSKIVIKTDLHDCEISKQGSFFRKLKCLHVKQIKSAVLTSKFITFDVECEHTKATLWMFLKELDLGHAFDHAGTAKRNVIDLSKIPARGIYSEEARLERLSFIREKTAAKLKSMQDTSLVAQRLTGNIENLIGSVEIPVGIAGPLLVKGEKARGTFYAPLATTEGALVASATRGATAISKSGGVSTKVVKQQMIRVPLFILSKMKGAFLFVDWIRDHVDEIREQTKKVSRHAQLISLEPFLLGNMVHIKFFYATGDAAGQNMTTTCTWQACQWIMQQMKHIPQIEFENFIIDANMSGDKKVNYQSFISGRGTRVISECFLDEAVLKKVLKVTPAQLAEAQRVVLSGSIQVGMIGHNINVANIIAAMFTSLGQDIACVHESSLAQLNIHEVQGGVYASMVLPSLIIGTVGGGTHLPRQNEFLQILGCAGPSNSAKLAEIIAGFCLSLDISTLSAVANGQFASAHEKLGRNKPVKWFSKEDLSGEFFLKLLNNSSPNMKLSKVEARPIKNAKMG